MRRSTIAYREDAAILPDGFHYQEDFITEDEEEKLLSYIRTPPFDAIRMHGVISKRRVVHFGWDYGYDSWKITPTEPIPNELLPLQKQAGELMRIDPGALQEVLITEYPPGAAIGWHRDAPMFGVVAGISLLSSSIFKLRPVRVHIPVIPVMLAPRSAYWLGGVARNGWQHSTRPAPELRYSITFRTLATRESDKVGIPNADGQSSCTFTT